MLIKSADDKQPDIDVLNALLSRSDFDVGTRQRIETDLRRIQGGVRGEREAAYEIEFHFGANPNRLTIHDLRLEVAGRVAQIDHLILDRLLGIWVCESKHFSEGVAVDEFGEWTGFYRHRPYGIGSPIEQNRKHIAVLTDAFADGLVSFPKRLGIAIRPELRSLVLVSKEARVSRPKSRAARERVDGLDSVIKIDQLATMLERDGASRGISGLRRVVTHAELERVGRQLVSLHTPIWTDWVAKFAKPHASAVPTRPRHEERPNGVLAPYSCVSCAIRVSLAVVEYCREHSGRFGDRILCMDCQQLAKRHEI